MSDDEKIAIERLNSIIEQILSGQKVTGQKSHHVPAENPLINQLENNIYILADQYNENFNFILELSKGKLNITPPVNNSFSNPYKEFHAELMHLTWQIQEIAKGDLEQQVSFFGDFSDAINAMIFSLKEKQKIESQNREHEQLFQTIFKTSPDGIFLTDLSGKIEFGSETGKTMFMVTDEDIDKGLNLFDFILPDCHERAKQQVADLISGNTTGVVGLRIRRADGYEFWIECNANVLLNPHEEVQRLFIIFRDITQRRMDEQKLQDFAAELKELNGVKDRFFSIIAHDLKNPFHGIMTMSNLLKEQMKSKNFDNVGLYAEIINEASAGGYKLLVNLLEWSRLQTGQMGIDIQPVPLSEVINDTLQVVQLNAIKKNITIHISGIHIIVLADKNMLSTILRNLLDNAIKYTHPEGHIHLKAKLRKGFIYISIADNGTGISRDDLAKLFQIDLNFTKRGTRDEKGTGLGLILCKDFIQKMGGEIWIESTPMKGSVFTVSVPAVKQVPTATEK